eukprot:6214393-Pleurochrysis_carterae.AAC.2
MYSDQQDPGQSNVQVRGGDVCAGLAAEARLLSAGQEQCGPLVFLPPRVLVPTAPGWARGPSRISTSSVFDGATIDGSAQGPAEAVRVPPPRALRGCEQRDHVDSVAQHRHVLSGLGKPYGGALQVGDERTRQRSVVCHYFAHLPGDTLRIW